MVKGLNISMWSNSECECGGRDWGFVLDQSLEWLIYCKGCDDIKYCRACGGVFYGLSLDLFPQCRCSVAIEVLVFWKMDRGEVLTFEMCGENRLLAETKTSFSDHGIVMGRVNFGSVLIFVLSGSSDLSPGTKAYIQEIDYLQTGKKMKVWAFDRDIYYG